MAEAAKDAIAYIEMTLAHTGAQSVEQIERELKRVVTIAEVSTSHHLGCPVTTRKVNLARAREALANLAKVQGSGRDLSLNEVEATAIEFGFKCCEKGMNLDATFARAEQLKGGAK